MFINKNRGLCALLLCAAVAGKGALLPAQEEGSREPGGLPEEGIPVEGDEEWDGAALSRYQRGDKAFIITVGTVFPTIFTGAISDAGHNLSPAAGSGSLAFSYFFGSHLFAGGEFGGIFNGTGGGNMLYIVPFGVRLGWQFTAGRFEFPITLMFGGAPQKYLEEGYFGLIAKAGASAFWRFNPDWSFGVNTAWWCVPQTPKNGKDVVGNFQELTLSARYHF